MSAKRPTGEQAALLRQIELGRVSLISTRTGGMRPVNEGGEYRNINAATWRVVTREGWAKAPGDWWKPRRVVLTAAGARALGRNAEHGSQQR